MKVSEMLEILSTLPPDAIVFEERNGEHREILRKNIRVDNVVFDADIREVVEFSTHTEFVILCAWS